MSESVLRAGRRKNKRITKNGVYIRDENNVNAMVDGFVAEHRMIMSDFLERKLERYENVIHINGDKCDNRIENLRIKDMKHYKQ